MQRIAFTVTEVAAARGCSTSAIWRRIRDRELAHIVVGGRTLVLAVDLGGLDDLDEMHDALASTWHGTPRLRLTDVARALGVHVSSLKAEAREGDLPAERAELSGWWSIHRDDLVSWILRRRVASKLEPVTA